MQESRGTWEEWIKERDTSLLVSMLYNMSGDTYEGVLEVLSSRNVDILAEADKYLDTLRNEANRFRDDLRTRVAKLRAKAVQ
jgi:hypothetical protein